MKMGCEAGRELKVSSSREKHADCSARIMGMPGSSIENGLCNSEHLQLDVGI